MADIGSDLAQGAQTVGKTLLTIMSAAAGVPQGQEKQRQEAFRLKAAQRDPTLLTLKEFGDAYDKAAGFKGAHNFELMHHAEQQRQQQSILRAVGMLPGAAAKPESPDAGPQQPGAGTPPAPTGLPPGVSYSTKYGGGELSASGPRAGAGATAGTTGVSKIWSDIDAEMAKDKPNMAKVKDLHDRLKVLTADPIAVAGAKASTVAEAKVPTQIDTEERKATAKFDAEMDKPLTTQQQKTLEMVDANGEIAPVDLNLPKRTLQEYADKKDAAGKPLYYVRSKKTGWGSFGTPAGSTVPLADVLPKAPKRTPPLRSSTPPAAAKQAPMSSHAPVDLTPTEQLERDLLKKYGVGATATGG
jgi:hypothetical protein